MKTVTSKDCWGYNYRIIPHHKNQAEFSSKYHQKEVSTVYSMDIHDNEFIVPTTMNTKKTRTTMLDDLMKWLDDNLCGRFHTRCSMRVVVIQGDRRFQFQGDSILIIAIDNVHDQVLFSIRWL